MKMITSLSFSPELIPLWETSLQKSSLQAPFLTYEWHRIYFSTDGKSEVPIIFHLPDLNIISAFGKKDTTASFVGPEITDYSDLIGPDENKIRAWKEIIPALQNLGIKKLFLTNIPASSPTYEYFLQASANDANISINQRDITPRIHPLPNTYEDFLAYLSKKNRHELERKQRKFLRENSEVCVCTKKGKDADMDKILSLMKLDGRKQEFLTAEHEAFFKALPTAFPDSLLTMILYVGDVAATAIVAFETKNSFLLYNSGFDQQHFSGGGFYLKAQSISYAISHKLSEYNFLRGGERYKYDLGGVNFPVYDITLTWEA